MTLMRRTEIESDKLYKSKEIRGFCHLYNGQEAIPVAMEYALTKDDHLITAYRDHAIALTKGHTPHRVMAEMMNRATGSTKGKGGSMHYYSREFNFYGGNGIVGAQIPVGTGVAFGIKYQGKPNVCISMYGDGASNQGQLFEAANMAGLWKLPVIYLIENNLYGMGTSIERSVSHLPICTRFRGFPAIRFDAMNVFLTKEIMKFSKDYAVHNGPIFLEAVTYRYHGHSMSDPGIAYRNKDEVNEVKATKDPIDLVKKVLIENKVLKEEEVNVKS